MTPASQRPPIASDDPAIEAEWRRLETARLAEEREEARENATEASGQTSESGAGRRWLLPAFGAALAAGIVLAIVLNARPPVRPPQGEPTVIVTRATEVWAEANRIDETALDEAAIRRVMSAGSVPEEQLVIRVTIRDQGGRDRLESLLAASGLRIESGPGGNAGGDETVIDSLAVSGPPADVDAFVDRLIASPTMLDVRSPALLAATAPAAAPADSVGGEPSPVPSATEKAIPPARVRMLVEVIELPAQVSEPASIPPEKSP